MDHVDTRFRQRVEEIDAFLTYVRTATSAAGGADQPTPTAQKVLKSTALIALYNLVEGTLTDAFGHLYTIVERRGHREVTANVRSVWIDHRFGRIDLREATLARYQSTASDMIREVVEGRPCGGFLVKQIGRGNLDAARVRDLCKRHGIHFTERGHGEELSRIKNIRNRLAHGTYTFAELGADESYETIRKARDDVIAFVEGVVEDMRRYIEREDFIVKTRAARA